MVEIKGIDKKFDEKIIFCDVNVTLNNTISLLLGDNGTGKSTLLNIMAGEVKQDSGEILVSGKSIHDISLKSKCAFMLETSDLMDELRGIDYLRLKYKFYKFKSLEMSQVQNLVDGLFETADFLNTSIGKYSTGMKKKIELISCLMLRPEILVLDEPFSGMDHQSVDFALQFLVEYQKDNRFVILIATHDKYVIESLISDKLTIHNSKVVIADQKIVK